ncbi:ubiquitin-conjugating enzyme E2 S, partial [Basidiobolus ranarum]
NFLTKIFHPNISLNGEVCGNILTDNWHFGLGISHVLMTLRCLLIQPKPESVLNAEAGILFHRNYEDYVRRAKLMTEIHACCKLYQEAGKPNRKRSGETKERKVNKKCTRRRL